MSDVPGRNTSRFLETQRNDVSIVGKAHKVNESCPSLPCVRSADLIGKDREIMIEHSGAYYRLRITRANKLILTK